MLCWIPLHIKYNNFYNNFKRNFRNRIELLEKVLKFDQYNPLPFTNNSIVIRQHYEERRYMKATGIVRRVDDLGRIVIPKEIRRTLRIREGDPLHTTLTSIDMFLRGIIDFTQRITGE